DVGVARLHGREQVGQRMAGERSDQVAGRERPFSQDAVVTPRSEWPWNRRRAREKPDDDGAVRVRRSHVDVRHEGVVDVRRDQLVVDRLTVVADLEDRLTLRIRGAKGNLVATLQVRAEVPVE